MIQSLIDTINKFTRRSLSDYCELETTIGDHSFVYRNNTMATLIRYGGVKRIVGDAEARNISHVLSSTLMPFFAGGCHELQMVLDRDEMPVQRIKDRMKPMYESAERMEMIESMSEVFDEQAALMASLTMHDTGILILFTHESALRKEDQKIWAANLLKQRREGKIHVPAGTQDETYAIEPLLALHEAFVDQVMDTLNDQALGTLCTVLKTSEASTLMKQSVDPLGTPDSWKAWLLPTSDVHFARKKAGETMDKAAPPNLKKEQPGVERVANTSLYFPPPLNSQFLDQAGNYTKDSGFFEYAGRIYATVVMTVPPKKVVRSSGLVYSLSSMRLLAADGSSQRVPFRLSTRLKSDGMKVISLRSMFAPLVSFGSTRNVKLMRAHKALSEEKNNDMAIVSISISITTWVNAGENGAIERLKSRLVAVRSAATQWGEMQVVEDSLDRAQAFLNSCPGITLLPCSVEGVGTLEELMPLLPLSRPASPLENTGVELYRSLDGSILTTEAHSKKQDFWLETMTAPMGGGKSAQANRKHLEYVFAPGRTTLPFLHILDIGGSVSGMVELLQDSLPEEKKYLAYLHVLRNNRENAVNMLDTKLGLRYPLEGDLSATVDFLTALVTPPERDRPYENMSDFIRTILMATYRRFDDGREQAQPRTYKPGNAFIDNALAECRVDPKPGTAWYAIADILGANNHIEAALRAHRKAVPLLPDLQAIANDDNIRSDFMAAKTEQGTPIPEAFAVQLGLARETFPIFTEETILDLRGRRITAIDLGQVAGKGSAGARKQASLMYQVAYELFSRNIRITADDMDYIPEVWKPYYRTLLEDLSTTDKHIAIDEYHRTMIKEINSKDSADHDTQGLRATLVREGGFEARKWQLSVTTISQLANHHGQLFNLASANHILKEGSVDETELQSRTMGMSQSDLQALKTFVTGPKKGIGVTFLSQWTTRSGKFNQLFTSSIAPKLLWSLSTTFEDKLIRKMVFDTLGRSAGRAVLSKHYPGGTAADEVERRKRSVARDDNAGDASEGAAKEVANELIALYRNNRGSY